MSDTIWILWDSAIDKPFARLFFDTQADAEAHRQRIISAYPRSASGMATIKPKEIPHPLAMECGGLAKPGEGV